MIKSRLSIFVFAGWMALANVLVACESQPLCDQCGVVQSIEPRQVEGDSSGVGAIAGAIIGGAVGSQVGGGSGQDAATAAGAVGGAVAGSEVEKRQKAYTVYDVGIKMSDGSMRNVTVRSVAEFGVNDEVRVTANRVAPA